MHVHRILKTAQFAFCSLKSELWTLSGTARSSSSLCSVNDKRKFHEHSLYDGSLRRRLREGLPTVGAITMSYGDTDHVEMLGLLGYDFLWADSEHSSASPESIQKLILAAERRGMPTIVRVGYGYQNIIGHVQKYLVSGAQGILLPQCESKEDVLKIVNAVKFPPIGRRGLAGERWNAWGLGEEGGTMADRLKKCNENSVIAVAIENSKGINSLEEILEVDELDFIFVAPMDLSVDMGFEGNFRHPEVTNQIEEIGKRIISKGKTVGMFALNSEDYKYWRERGFQVICCWAQSMFLNGARDFLGYASEYESGRNNK